MGPWAILGHLGAISGPSWGHLAGKPKRTLYLTSKNRKQCVLRYKTASNINLIVGEREARSVKMSLHMLECLWTSWGASWGSFPLCCCLLLQNSTLNPKPLPVVLCIQRQRHNMSHDRSVRESLGRTFRPGVCNSCFQKATPWNVLGIIHSGSLHVFVVLCIQRHSEGNPYRGPTTELSGRALGGHFDLLGASWGLLGAILRPPGAILGPSWGRLGASWGLLGPS